METIGKVFARAEKAEAREEELEKKINWWAYNLPILECKDVINEMLIETCTKS